MSFLLVSFRSVAREWRRNPGFLLIAVLTLGVALGANAAIFTVVDAVLIRPLPFPEADRLVVLRHDAPGLKLGELIDMSEAIYVLYRRENRVLSDLGIYLPGEATVTGGTAPERVEAATVTGSVFNVLGVPPSRGRTIQEADEKPGAEKVVVVSDALWRRRLGGGPNAVGSILQIDGVARRIVGVMPPRFPFPTPATEIWTPHTLDPAHLNLGGFSTPGIGRLRPGVSLARATRELSALIWRVPEVYPGQGMDRAYIANEKLTVNLASWRDEVVGNVEQILWILLGSVACLLLIACANVANLFLVRAEGRQRDVAVRTALGAARGDIARLFLGESLALSLAGGALGLALAWAGLRLLVSLRPSGVPRLEEIGVDGRVLLFTLALSVVAGLFCGGIAALRYGSPALAPALREGGRGDTAGRGRLRARNLLVIAQVALALVLLASSGLMLKSFRHLRNVDPGFDPRGVLTLQLDLPSGSYPDAAAIIRFTEQLLARAAALPGVTSAAAVRSLPLTGAENTGVLGIEDFPFAPGEVPPVFYFTYVTPGYFRAMGIPLRAGQAFDGRAPQSGEQEIVVSRSVAERFWKGRSALGKRFFSGPEKARRWDRIIGIAGDVHGRGLEKPPEDRLYRSMLRLDNKYSEASWPFTLVVRSRTAPTSLVKPLRQVVRALDPNLPVSEIRPLEDVVARSIERTSFTMLLLAIAATVALLLGAVGIYGVISYVVSQRTREIGVRMALGARRRDISRMVLREGLGITLLGIAIGLAAALAATRLMLAILYDVSPADPWTFAVVPLLLAAVALLASWLPARRAAKVEPLEAISYE
jgi:putative ABC transport system permease protein